MNRKFILSAKQQNPVISTRQQKPVISTGTFAYFANAEWRDPCICLCICLCFFVAPTALGQGCTQCLDSTQAAPPAVQAAYRHAIILLASAGATLFIVGTLLLRRQR
jgi:hypothetical protein